MSDLTACIDFLADDARQPAFRIYPPSSGRGVDSPAMATHEVLVRDCRGADRAPTLAAEGFALTAGAPIGEVDLLDAARVRADFYPAIEALVRVFLGAEAVFAFDHNLRSVARSAQGERGVNSPVPQAHGDYTPASAARRRHEVLTARGQEALAGHAYALVNAWCPLRGPVLDVPLAVCDARSITPGDLVETTIDHFADDDLVHPSHSGQIYSLRYNARQRWYYAAAMRAGEVLLLKCFESHGYGAAACAPHAAFRNPACPAEFVPRESVEVRTLVVWPAAHAH